MSLAALQRGVINHLVSGSTGIHAAVRGGAAPRLAVHHNAYRMQLLACMADTYEKTKSWLGDSEFDAAALRYIEAHVPVSWTLDEYAQDFDETLGEIYAADAEVPELAWLDWTLRHAFVGTNAHSMTRDEFAGVNWESAVLHFVPTLRVRSVSTNSAAIWTAMAAGGVPPPATSLTAPAALRVWRHHLTPRFRSIDAEEHHALGMVMAKKSFADVCVELSQRHLATKAIPKAAECLGSWVGDGLISRVEVL